MLSLYEKTISLIRAGKVNYEHVSEDWVKDVLAAQPIDITQVADYFYAQDKEYFQWSDFPNVAPPFESLWLEAKLPPFTNVEGSMQNLELGNQHVAFLLSSKRTDFGWMCRIMLILKEIGSSLPTIFGSSFLVYAVHNDGSLWEHEDEKTFLLTAPKDLQDDPQILEAIARLLQSSIMLPFMALSFMHCKNIKLITEVPKKSISGRKRYGPREQYKILEITPLKTILEGEGDIQHTGLKKALHICRGHFKTFTEEKPLLGKAVGTYFWHDFIRGDPNKGVVDKSYKVNPPNETNDNK